MTPYRRIKCALVLAGLSVALSATEPVAAHAAAAGRVDGQLYRIAGTLPEEGEFEIYGTLDGLRPDGRVVRGLVVHGLIRATSEGLRPLTAFTQLRGVRFEQIAGVDLTPLATLELERLALSGVRDLDLSPLGILGKLRDLSLTNVKRCQVPPTLTLAASLETLVLRNDGFRITGAPVQALIEAIDWRGLGGLRFLSLRVGSVLDPLPPIKVDLRLLRHLPRLDELTLEPGVWHRGPGPSPVKPPFKGLARTLSNLFIDAWRPGIDRPALERYLPRSYIGIEQRHNWKLGEGSWTIYPPDLSFGLPDWYTLGSLFEAGEGRDGASEDEARRTARRKLRAASPALLKRIDVTSLGSETGLAAPTRRDLARALHVLGLR